MNSLAPETRKRALSRRELLAGIGSTLVLQVGCRTRSQSSNAVPTALLGNVFGDSMAPHYLGTTGLLQCDACGERQPVTLAYGSRVDWCCPRCGTIRPSEIVNRVNWQAPRIFPFDRSTTAAGPQRWQPVAIAFDQGARTTETADVASQEFTDSGQQSIPSTWTLKRIWGLPGERIAIENGEWLVDGRIVPRDWTEQCELRVLVATDRASRWTRDHWSELDSGHGRARSGPQRIAVTSAIPTLLSTSVPTAISLPPSAPAWHALIDPTATNGDGVWTPTAGGWNVTTETSVLEDRAVDGGGADSSTEAPAAGAVLEYRHRRCVVATSEERETNVAPPEAVIEDFLAYDPFRPRRLFPVFGLMLEMSLRLQENSELTIALHDGRGWVNCLLSTAESKLRVRDGFNELHRERFDAAGKSFRFAMSTFDRRVVWAIDDRQAGAIELAGRESRSRDEAITAPARLIGRGELAVENLTLWRDLHLLGPHPSIDHWKLERSLEADEYFVMGDHFAASVDNRISGRGARRHELIGRVESGAG